MNACVKGSHRPPTLQQSSVFIFVTLREAGKLEDRIVKQELCFLALGSSTVSSK